MKLIIAQGNPGNEYETTRHNIGFQVLDAFAATHNAPFSEQSKFKAHIASFTENGEKVLLAKPLTFYNETGISARALVDFYKLDPATDVLVVHDELALPFGTIRTREKGSDGGNNGIKSLNAHLGASFKRIRIGIWNDLRDKTDDAQFVLSHFSVDERQALPDITSKAQAVLADFTHGTFTATTT